MRLWLGPSGQELDCDELDISHSRLVAWDPELFGLEKDPVLRHVEAVNDAEGEIEFEFDLMIAMAEEKGWVRVARDGNGHGLTISGSNVDAVRQALGNRMIRDFPGVIQVEIERIDGDSIQQEFGMLPHCNRGSFRRGMFTPQMKSYATHITNMDLLSALGQERIIKI